MYIGRHFGFGTPRTPYPMKKKWHPIFFQIWHPKESKSSENLLLTEKKHESPIH